MFCPADIADKRRLRTENPSAKISVIRGLFFTDITLRKSAQSTGYFFRIHDSPKSSLISRQHFPLLQQRNMSSLRHFLTSSIAYLQYIHIHSSLCQFVIDAHCSVPTFKYICGIEHHLSPAVDDG